MAFPHKRYGQCPVCDPIGQGETGGAYSSNQADPGGDVPLVWSSVYQNYVCKLCLRQGKDLPIDEKRSDRILETDRFLNQVGYRDRPESE